MLNSGIYEIVCLAKDGAYIGKTYSKVGFDKRFQQHIRLLIANKHYNIHLQRAWNKYGKDNFIFRILEYCIDEVLNQREISWISNYKMLKRNIYNMTDGGTGGATMTGKIFSKEHRKKLSEAKKGHIATEKTRLKMSIARNGRGLTPNAIEITRKFHTGRKRSLETCRNISLSKIGKKQRPETVLKRMKGVIQLDKNNNEIAKYNSIKDAQKQIGCWHIGKVCSGKLESSGGFRWKFILQEG